MKAEILISLIVIRSSASFAGKGNIAVDKPTSQSSNLTYPGPEAVWIAGNAVDGMKECQAFDCDHYSGTNNEEVPWWQVDLQRIYNITHIIVYGPNITHREQLHGFRVFISSSESGQQQSIYDNTDYGNDEIIIQLPTESVKTNMSSVASNRTSDLAIDGNFGPDPDQCQCCSETANSQLSWWTVDFREYLPVKKVIIYSRNNENDYQHLDNFQLKFSNSTVYNSTLNQSTITVLSSKLYQISFPNILTKSITIQRPGVLTICEITVVKGDCKVGTYGSGCSRSCLCGDSKPCDSGTGQCQSRSCKTGWTGSACNKKCLPDTFGDECRETCYCAVGTCTNNYGISPGKCRRGYFGPHCNQNKGNETDINIHRKDDTAVGGAVGGSVVVLGLIASSVAIVYKCWKRHSDENNDKDNTNTSTIYITPTESAQYDTIYTSTDKRESTNSSYTSVTGF